MSAAVAAILFALDDDDGIEFLRYWNEGEFDIVRRNWPDAPETIYIGADPLHPATVLAPVSTIDLAKLTRYFGDTTIGATIFEHHEGDLVKLDDVRQLVEQADLAAGQGIA